MMVSILIYALLVAGSASDQQAPLTQTQITKLQQVVRRTQDRNVELKASLEDRQQDLMTAYSQFELDGKRIDQLHQEIVDLQRQLLEVYRELQVDLRDIVGEERFLHLKKRIDLMLKGQKKAPAPPGTSSSIPSTEENAEPTPESQTP